MKGNNIFKNLVVFVFNAPIVIHTLFTKSEYFE